MTDAQKNLIVKLGQLGTYHEEFLEIIATLFTGEETRANLAYAPKDAALYPVNVDSLTPSSTFVKNAVIGINGVIYRAKKATSNFPVTMVVQDGAFVTTSTQDGKIVFVTSGSTVNSDWEKWTDAAIEYWTEQLDARTTALENAFAALQSVTADIATIRANAAAGAAGVASITYGGQTYTCQQLLTAMASLMSKTVVTQ